MMKTMQDYILEQPEILSALVQQDHISQIQTALQQAGMLSSQPAPRLVMIASGTSYNAAVTASHYIKIATEIFYPYEFNQYTDVSQYPANTLFIVISQGGESIETYYALDKVKKQYKTIALTAAKNSTIAKQAHCSLLFGCGTETVIYRSKGFTASLLMLIIIGNIVSHDNHLSQLTSLLPDKTLLSGIIQQSRHFFQRHRVALTQAQAFFFVGAGKNIATCNEAALKAIETIRLPVMCYELEEFVHGPQNAINEYSHIIIIENHDDRQDKAWKLFHALRKLQKQAWLIAAKDHTEFADYLFKRPVFQMDELLTICILQQFCYSTSQFLGVDLTQRGFAELADYIKKTFC